MFKGRLTKLSDNENAMRTEFMDGEFTELPKIGQGFEIFGEPLEFGTTRQIYTSDVKDVTTVFDGLWIFETEFSKYKLELNVYD